MSARWKGPSRDHGAAAGIEAEAIRFSTPTAAPPNTRRKAGENERSGASRQKAGGFAGTDSGAPRQRGGQPHRSAAKKRPFLLDRSAARFLFNKIEKKMGGGVHCRTPANPRPMRRSSVLPLAPVGLPPRRERRVLRGEGGGDMSANPGCVVPFFAEWDVDGPFRCCSQI